ncbi:MAG: DUF4859 domain-containing protein [Prevotella sp.]|nr:DUF4859 domain-containing protein [Prevotella sp.]
MKMIHFGAFLAALLMMALSSSAQTKQLYTPVEWQNFNANETLLYKKTDTANQYTWSETRSKQSDNCIVYWDKGYGSTAPNQLSTSSEYYVDIDDLLAKAEAFYQLECNTLGFVDPSTSNVSKYKIMILLNHTTDWICYGGGYDFQISALWLSPSTCHPVGSAVAHEVGHSFHYMCYAEDSNHGAVSSCQTGFHGAVGNGAAIWETTANWQALQSYPEEIFTESYTYDVFSKSHNYAFSHEWHRYQAYMFLFYLCQYYNDIQTVAKVWNYPETTVKDFNQVLMDLKGLSVSDLYRLHYEFALRAVTWDLDACVNYRNDSYIGNFNYFYVPLTDGSYQVAYASAPQATGFNVIPLQVPAAGTQITTALTALTPGCALASGDPAQYLDGNTVYSSAGVTKYNSVSNASSRGFRAGYVALLNDGTRQYFDDGNIHCTGTDEVTENFTMTVPNNVKQLWLVVAPTPSSYYQHKWDESVTNDDQWPYRVKFTNTDIGPRATAQVSPTLDGRDIQDVTLTYDVSLKPASDYSGATVTVNGVALATFCTALQLSSSDISDKWVSWSANGPSNGQVMFYAVNPSDMSFIENGSTANGDGGHWFNATGGVTNWGNNSYVFSEFTKSDIHFFIGQYPDLNSAGDTRTVCQALRYKDSDGNEATAYFVFNITFDADGTNSGICTDIDYGGTIEPEDKEKEHVWVTFDVTMKPATDYSGATATVDDNAMAVISQAFGLTKAEIVSNCVNYSAAGPSEEQVMFYAADASEALVEQTNTANGYGYWFDANGDVTNWNNNSYVFAEFTPSDMTFTVGQFPGLNADGDTRTIREALRYKDNNGYLYTAYFIFNITFDDNATANAAEVSRVEYDGTILLDEYSTTEPPTVVARNVVYNRRFATGWNSICLPIDVTLDELGVVKAVEYIGTTQFGTDTYQADFDIVNTLQANTPYMVKCESPNTEDLVFTDKDIHPLGSYVLEDLVNGAYSMIGTQTYYSRTTSPILSGDYIINTAGLVSANGGNALRGFRAYIKKMTASAAKIGHFNVPDDIWENDGDTIVSDDAGVVDGISVMEFGPSDARHYGLSGVEVSPVSKGIHIVNGKKVVVK